MVLAIRLATAGKSSWFLAGLITALEFLFVVVASGEWLVFFHDRVVKRTVFGQIAVAYTDIAEVSGRGGLRISGGGTRIDITTETFLRSV